MFEESSKYKEDDYLVALRYRKYCHVRKDLYNIFQKAEKAWKTPIFKNIISYLSNTNDGDSQASGESTNDLPFMSKEVPLQVAFFHVSMEQDVTEKLSIQLKEFMSLPESPFQEDFIVRLSCQRFKSMKAIIAHMVSQFFIEYETETDPVTTTDKDDDGDARESSSAAASETTSKNAPDLYSLDTILKEWTDEVPQIIILMDSIESMKRDLLNDFLAYLRYVLLLL